MNPEHMLKDIKKQFKDILKKYPEEKKNSVGYVCDNLKLHHIKAAIFMYQNNGMQINAYNLHDLIMNYDQYKTIAEFSPDDMVLVDLTDIQPGEFNPKHLVVYFRELSQLQGTDNK